MKWIYWILSRECSRLDKKKSEYMIYMMQKTEWNPPTEIIWLTHLHVCTTPCGHKVFKPGRATSSNSDEQVSPRKKRWIIVWCQSKQACLQGSQLKECLMPGMNAWIAFYCLDLHFTQNSIAWINIGAMKNVKSTDKVKIISLLWSFSEAWIINLRSDMGLFGENYIFVKSVGWTLNITN